MQREIQRFYDNGLEAGRLESPFFRWEKIRTLDLMERFLPAVPAIILDIGGGAGAYSFPLAEKGYIVDLIDPVPLHIKQAKERATLTQRAPRHIAIREARSTPHQSESADAVLLFGPLYHLTESHDRLAAIREAHRVLRTAGILMAVAISRFASGLDGIGRGTIRDPEFARIVQQDLMTGQHRNETGNPDYFTTAFFHHPDEFRQELVAGGFPAPTLCAIEGPLWKVPEMETTAQWDALMAVARMLERENTLIGASAHIMGIAQKTA